MSAAVDPVRALANCLVFQALDAESRTQLVRRAHRKAYRFGEIVFAMGDPGASLMVVINGTVRISLPSPNARQIVLADLGPGAVFGEVAMLDGHERSADATALTACELLICDRRDVMPFLEGHWETCFRLMQLLCSRLRATDDRMADIAFFDLPERLARAILDQARPHVAVPGEPPVPRLTATQGQLAEMVGGARETVNRCLSAWRRAGLVELDRGRLLVRRPEALRRIADGS